VLQRVKEYKGYESSLHSWVGARERLAACCFMQPLEEDVKYGGHKHTQYCTEQQTADRACSERAVSPGADAAREPQRKPSHNKRNRCHEDGTKPDACAFERGLHDGITRASSLYAEFHDQDRVLGQKADEHHQCDLEVYVHLKTGQLRGHVGAHYPDGQ